MIVKDFVDRTSETNPSPGRRAFEAYRTAILNASSYGWQHLDLRRWLELGQHERDAWEAVARAVAIETAVRS